MSRKFLFWKRESAPQASKGKYLVVPLHKLLDNPFQIRKTFPEDSLRSLADSIQKHGLLQPLVVKQVHEGFFEVIIGTRRLAACRMIRMSQVPVLVMEFSEKDFCEISVLENIQRCGLTPLEEAHAYERIKGEFVFSSTEELAARLGVSKEHVEERLKLLKLPEIIKKGVDSGMVSPQQAILLLNLPAQEEQIQAFLEIHKNQLDLSQTMKMLNLRKSRDREG